MWWSILTGNAEPIEQLDVSAITIAEHTIQVEVADESHERQLGLMHRTKMDSNAGMIFVYKDAQIRSFWMKNTYIPLSIAYVDSSCKVVHITDMTPLNTKGVSSNVPVQFALEMNQGWFDVKGVGVGDLISGIAHCATTNTLQK